MGSTASKSPEIDAEVTLSLPDGVDAERLTPAMRQYWEHKKQAGDAILMFRMGDFYEMFYDDAELAARVLGIALTSRDRGKTPLAGIPHHALETYLSKLVVAGYKVAISEQMEDAKHAKGVVKRAVVRVVTPGTLTDEALLETNRSNVLAAVCEDGERFGIAAVELAAGEMTVTSVARESLADELNRIAPSEILLPEPDGVGRSPLEALIRERVGTPITYRGELEFAAERAGELLRRQFGVASLEAFGFERVDASLRAAGAVLAYLNETQRTALEHIRPPRRRSATQYLELDTVTLRSLEVERTLRGNAREGTLLSAVDLTRNPMGARLLRRWLCYPLRDVAEIGRRQDVIELLRGDDGARDAIRGHLHDIGDIERRTARIAVKRTNPRELRAMGDALNELAPLRMALRGLAMRALDGLAERLEGLDELADRLCEQLERSAPLAMREGGIFQSGRNAELDRLRVVGRDGRQWLANYQARELERTGIANLKIGYNKVFGYYIEITHAHRERVPDEYVRKQTVKNAERYITDELKRFEGEALSAESRANDLEYELFQGLRAETAAFIPKLQDAAGALAELDVLAGWAELAVRRDYCRPEFVDEPVLEIEQGRHAVVEQSHEVRFVPNETRLIAGGDSCGLITGPNMAGKSTYIRQVALLTLLAHCGCCVPARRMRLGVVDRIFTRVGASDELARGQSTFMVEMLETANILHNATRRSLVILDEVGRGTSTFDGVALAWAITEHLAKCGCRTLFATHYHELTELAELLGPVFNLNVEVREYEDRIVFLHRIVAGAADRSYGLHVGKLAGLPAAVLERAGAVLNELEKTFARESQRPALAAAQRRRQRQLRLFDEPEEAIVRELRETACGEVEPAAALELIRKWRGKLGADEARAGGP